MRQDRRIQKSVQPTSNFSVLSQKSLDELHVLPTFRAWRKDSATDTRGWKVGINSCTRDSRRSGPGASRLFLRLAACLGSELPSETMTLGLMISDLSEEKQLARLDLVRFGVAVLRRTALDHIGMTELAFEPNGLDDLVSSWPARPTNGTLEHPHRRPAPRQRTSGPHWRFRSGTRPAICPARAACSVCSPR